MATAVDTSSRQQLTRELEETNLAAYESMMGDLWKAYEQLAWYFVREANKKFNRTKKKECTVSLDLNQVLKEFHLFREVDEHFTSMLAAKLSWMWSEKGRFFIDHNDANNMLTVKFHRD